MAGAGTPALADPGAPQEAVVIRGDGEELPCVIEWTSGAVYEGRGLEDESWVSDWFDLKLLEDGRLAVWEQLSPEGFLLATPDEEGGTWVGRGGEGPGEYRWVRWVRAANDRLHVFDMQNLRRTVLDQTALDVLHANRIEVVPNFGIGAAVLSDSSYVLNASIPSPERAGLALHLFNGVGNLVRSFDERTMGLGSAPDDPFRWLAASPRFGGLWSAPFREYRIDLWDPSTGTLRRSLRREVPWWPVPPAPDSWDPNRVGPPRVTGVAEDPAGWLLVSYAVPAVDRWRDCFVPTPPQAPEEAGEYTLREGCSTHDTRIEALDPITGRLMAAGPPPMNEVGAWVSAGKGWFVAAGRDALGFPRFHSWRLRLRAAGAGCQLAAAP